jgi:hypothetical protein
MGEKTDTNVREMKAEIKTNREEMITDQEGITARLRAQIETNNEKIEVFEVLLSLGRILTKPGHSPLKSN